MEEVQDHSYIRKNAGIPRLKGYIEEVHTILEEDSKSRQTRTMRSVFERLQDKGFSGSYSAVCRYLSELKSQDSGCNDAYIPLDFESGEAYQFDWSTETIQISGELMKVKVAHFVCCHSRMKFCYTYMNETQEMVFDAHIRAFEFFGGVPRRGIYDNMKTAVKKILKGKYREWNPAFERLCAHYRIEPVACNPAAGWEKGQVEKQVSVDRLRFFTPIPKVNSLAEFNEQLMSRVRVYNQSKRHPKLKGYSIQDVFEKEKPSLCSLPRPFDGSRSKDVRVSSTCLVMFDRNNYSVDCRYAGKIVQCKAYANQLVFVYQGREISRHERRFGSGETSYDWQHYLPVLIRKPGALRNGAPFKQMGLPDAIEHVRVHLQDNPKSFIQILACIVQTSIHDVEQACEKAIAQKAISQEVILHYLFNAEESHLEDIIPLPPKLVLRMNPTADCCRYNQLLITGAQ
jgi:transposase